jgi:hypothetical protein
VTRAVRDEPIKGQGDRAKIAVRSAPYWAAVDKHLHVGYRKAAKEAAGWHARI